MSDSYERVMANSVPADCRQLASMLLEMEEIFNYVFYRKNIKNDFKYIIYSQRLSNQGNSNQWEGIVGEFKNILKKENVSV